jgi:glutamine amidotransferase
MIAIIDYEMGNIGSVYNMLKKIGVKSVITKEKSVIEAAEKIIIPGVGAFDSGMQQLAKYDLISLIKKKVLEDKTPILGICLGAQLMLQSSEEGIEPGLGFLKGSVKRFDFSKIDENFPIPSMGWNQVFVNKNSNISDSLPNEPRFYFVHSYHFKLENEADVLMTSEYGYKFTSAFENGNIAGVQFHPEKSHKFGMALLGNFSKSF